MDIGIKARLFICTFAGIGFFPKAPGTAASFAAVLILYFFPMILTHMAILMLILFIAGLMAIPGVEAHYGTDPGLIVIDEMIGQWTALLFLPHTAWVLAAAFVLFRLFDIFKPLGINALQKLPGAYGVLLDDILAGIYSFMLIQLILSLI